MMENPDFILRSIQPDDIAGAMKLSSDEGWNQTKKDWELLTESPQNICILAEHKQKVVGTTTAINYSNQIAWIGMVLVAKENRGQGLSKLLLTNIFKRLESFKSIKLDATPEGQQVYKRFDFKDEFIITRMTITPTKSLSSDNINILPEPVHEKDIGEIISLDAQVFGANRTQLCKWLIKEHPQKAWMLKQNNRITGFALGRDGNKYHQIGPVIAQAIPEAKALITKAFNNFINQPIVIDVLSDKEDLINWLNSIGFIKQRNFIRMYKNKNPFPGMSDKQFAICGPEFG
ncbi:MAG: GNAT family N-acetyltransferase [Ginsengibacter sp.]